MNYENYERRIVETYGVALYGWPCGPTVRNPGSLEKEKLEKLFEALSDSELMPRICYWIKLSDDDLSARIASNRERMAAGEVVYKPRKKAAPKNGPKNVDIVESSDESSSGDDNEE